MQSIKELKSIETYAVRQPVLRPGLPVTSCVFPNDDLNTTIHFGIYDNNSLAGIVSVFENSNKLFAEKIQFQIRGMAILPEHQKKGLGEKLVKKAEGYANSKNGQLLWFNAREVAVGFYKKMGYHTTGNPFDIEGVGIHYVMHKQL
ncbi:GNAT family N-acetyltransferase [Flavobacterium arcticum]|uniref:GNAT family N-acetyltransferase n=1 Tax=Flavobacterium arcticum TaxID=1784713 RepID=A0A345HCB3_9FLAO|nr:GNAT family N-acetyltransferase [Flavobacterium arcticum]AXG74223.1 GNAT family N-acetyltransferase [Flavobacterium arcticum]KAF2508190.1 GNAT family N-acetyltransferase [Flavobacterium arcticum]